MKIKIFPAKNNYSEDMASKLSDIKVGPLVTKRRRKEPIVNTSQLIQTTESQALATIPELVRLQQIDGSQPFLTRDLIPDVIYMLRYEGSQALIDTLPGGQNDIIEVQGAPPVRKEDLLETLKTDTWETFLTNLYPYTRLQLGDLQNRIYNAAVLPMTMLFASANSRDPDSIIFQHSTQNIHAQTQKIEIELIKDEPEITERQDLQCTSCGERRIRAIPVQVRRADEPPTIYAQCVSCKHRWSFSSA